MIVICGLPNAGKTTYSARYENVVHYDDLGMTTAQRHNYLKEIVKNDEKIVCEGVFGEHKMREDLCRSATGRKTCIWIDTPADVCRQRENRGRPTAIVDVHEKMFHPPTLDEGWDEIVVVKG